MVTSLDQNSPLTGPILSLPISLVLLFSTLVLTTAGGFLIGKFLPPKSPPAPGYFLPEKTGLSPTLITNLQNPALAYWSIQVHGRLMKKLDQSLVLSQAIASASSTPNISPILEITYLPDKTIFRKKLTVEQKATPVNYSDLTIGDELAGFVSIQPKEQGWELVGKSFSIIPPKVVQAEKQ